MGESGRTLIYVPIIHTDPDLGSLSSDVEEKATSLLGERWKRHKKTVEQYWKEILKYFENKKVKGVKIFQDGLPEGGKVAQVMVERLAKTGSPNYRLLKKLVSRGAILQKTEDPALLKEEYQLTKELVAKKNWFLAILSFLKYKLKKGTLLKARDEFITQQINQNLKEEEIGICFLGAYHQVLGKLAKGIRLLLLKKPEKVEEYYQAFSSSLKEGTVNERARYLTKPVKNGLVICNTKDE